MSITLPLISWEAIITNSASTDTSYYYTCTVTKNNPNDPGYGDLQVGYYIVDFVGHLFEITAVDGISVTIYDILETENNSGPYNLRESYIYSSLYDAALLVQAKLNRLDESAEDFVRSLGLNPKVVDAIQFNTNYTPCIYSNRYRIKSFM